MIVTHGQAEMVNFVYFRGVFLVLGRRLAIDDEGYKHGFGGRGFPSSLVLRRCLWLLSLVQLDQF